MHGLKSIPGLSGNQCDIRVSLENLYIKPRQTKQNVTLTAVHGRSAPAWVMVLEHKQMQIACLVSRGESH